MKTLDKLSAPVSARDWRKGPIDAAAQLLEYGDFECPYCAAAQPLVQAIHEAMGKDLCFAFRNFPLTNVHPHAEGAAEAAEAAGAQERYWQMHDLLYQNQDALEYQDFASYAAELRLDAQRLVSEVMARRYAPRVREDFMTGVRSGVNGTPTFFINGVRYDGPRELDAMLDALSQPAESD
jgi:protein-disulfide isomerase